MILREVKKIGRPKRGESRESLTLIAFKAGANVCEALVALEEQVRARTNRRSIAIRRAILAAYDQLQEKKK